MNLALQRGWSGACAWELINATPRKPTKPDVSGTPPVATIEAARSALNEASAFAQPLGRLAQITLQEQYAHELLRTSKGMPEAQAVLEAAVRARKDLTTSPLAAAAAIREMALARQRVSGELEGDARTAAPSTRSRPRFRRAVAIYERHAPNSVELALAMTNLGDTWAS